MSPGPEDARRVHAHQRQALRRQAQRLRLGLVHRVHVRDAEVPGGEELALVRGAAVWRRAQRGRAGGVDSPLDLRPQGLLQHGAGAAHVHVEHAARRPRGARMSRRPRGTPCRRPSSPGAPPGGRGCRTSPAPRRGRSSRLPSPRTATRRSSPRSRSAWPRCAPMKPVAPVRRVFGIARREYRPLYRVPSACRRSPSSRTPPRTSRPRSWTQHGDRGRAAVRGLRIRPDREGVGDHRLRRRSSRSCAAPILCPTTSQPSVGDFIACFEQLARAGPRRGVDPHLGGDLRHGRLGPPGRGAAGARGQGRRRASA